MKTKIDRPTLGHVMFYCTNAAAIQFADPVVTYAVHEQLNKLGEKCNRKQHQKKMSIKFTGAELLALKTITDAAPGPSALIIREYVINPLLKQL